MSDVCKKMAFFQLELYNEVKAIIYVSIIKHCQLNIEPYFVCAQL